MTFTTTRNHNNTPTNENIGQLVNLSQTVPNNSQGTYHDYISPRNNKVPKHKRQFAQAQRMRGEEYIRFKKDVNGKITQEVQNRQEWLNKGATTQCQRCYN